MAASLAEVAMESQQDDHPLADRHPPNLASSVQETGRLGGADGSIVTGTPLTIV
jgi:hypothetical protein